MIGGFGVGASLIIAPMYIAEIAPAEIRGQMVSFNQLNIVIGITVAFFTNYLILQLADSPAHWACRSASPRTRGAGCWGSKCCRPSSTSSACSSCRRARAGS